MRLMRVLVLAILVGLAWGPNVASATAQNQLASVESGGYSTLNQTTHTADAPAGEGTLCYAGCAFEADNIGDGGLWHSLGADTDQNAAAGLGLSANFPATMGSACEGYTGDFSDFTAEPGHNVGYVGFERYMLNLMTFEPNGFAPTSWGITFNMLGNNTRAADACVLVYSFDPNFTRSYIFTAQGFSVGSHTISGDLDGSVRVLVGIAIVYASAGAAAPISITLGNFYATSGGGGGGGGGLPVEVGIAAVIGAAAGGQLLLRKWGKKE